MAEHLVVAAGTPVLMVPAEVTAEIGKTVLLGWDGSREACRAAHDALPFLCAARAVVLCSVGEPYGSDLQAAAAMLSAMA